MINIKWDRKDSKEVEKARDFFNKQTKQGWLAAELNSEFKRLLVFKPELEELWFIPLVEGG